MEGPPVMSNRQKKLRKRRELIDGAARDAITQFLSAATDWRKKFNWPDGYDLDHWAPYVNYDHLKGMNEPQASDAKPKADPPPLKDAKAKEEAESELYMRQQVRDLTELAMETFYMLSRATAHIPPHLRALDSAKTVVNSTVQNPHLTPIETNKACERLTTAIDDAKQAIKVFHDVMRESALLMEYSRGEDKDVQWWIEKQEVMNRDASLASTLWCKATEMIEQKEREEMCVSELRRRRLERRRGMKPGSRG